MILMTQIRNCKRLWSFILKAVYNGCMWYDVLLVCFWVCYARWLFIYLIIVSLIHIYFYVMCLILFENLFSVRFTIHSYLCNNYVFLITGNCILVWLTQAQIADTSSLTYPSCRERVTHLHLAVVVVSHYHISTYIWGTKHRGIYIYRDC